jgi:hypothetical protein
VKDKKNGGLVGSSKFIQIYVKVRHFFFECPLVRELPWEVRQVRLAAARLFPLGIVGVRPLGPRPGHGAFALAAPGHLGTAGGLLSFALDNDNATGLPPPRGLLAAYFLAYLAPPSPPISTHGLCAVGVRRCLPMRLGLRLTALCTIYATVGMATPSTPAPLYPQGLCLWPLAVRARTAPNRTALSMLLWLGLSPIGKHARLRGGGSAFAQHAHDLLSAQPPSRFAAGGFDFR